MEEATIKKMARKKCAHKHLHLICETDYNPGTRVWVSTHIHAHICLFTSDLFRAMNANKRKHTHTHNKNGFIKADVGFILIKHYLQCVDHLLASIWSLSQYQQRQLIRQN